MDKIKRNGLSWSKTQWMGHKGLDYRGAKPNGWDTKDWIIIEDY